MSPVCYVVGAVKSDVAILPGADDFVIAADAGFDTLVRRGIRCDLLVGDFDSIDRVPENVPAIRYPVMKDDTDMLIAVKLGFERGYNTFYIYGGLGGRLDHTLANIQVLAYIAEQGGEGYLIGDGENLTVIKNNGLLFGDDCSGTISVFAFGGNAVGVTLAGLRYPLENAVLTPVFPIGVSNAFTGNRAVVRVRDGMLTVIWSGVFKKPNRDDSGMETQ